MTDEADTKNTAKNTANASLTRNESPWRRLLYLILFAVIFNIVEIIIFFIAIIQFVSNVVAGKTNTRLRLFGYSLAAYAREIIEFVTYYSDRKPYPFHSWPGSGSLDE